MKRLANYSQHFFRSPQLIKELIGHSTIKSDDLVLDIGAGSGTISSVLATRVKSVAAYEFEPRTAETLKLNMRQYANVRVIEGDFLTMPLPNGPYKIFSNIPFHLSSPIIHKITEADNPPQAAYLIVQKQFANKLLPSSDHFTGQLGMVIGPQFAVRIRKHLLRSDYSPPPNVDTVMIELLLRPEPLLSKSDMPAYREFIVGCFSTPKIFAKAPRYKVGLPDNIKPSQMKLVQWIKLFQAANNR
jgi:16S rRNA A1518/A1519 N6-dimethyltransferase RsmA/KsgA/DIM1 with predicted DNA glycosylase/AP lyase activity